MPMWECFSLGALVIVLYLGVLSGIVWLCTKYVPVRWVVGIVLFSALAYGIGLVICEKYKG